jgi:hypothetical protein
VVEHAQGRLELAGENLVYVFNHGNQSHVKALSNRTPNLRFSHENASMMAGQSWPVNQRSCKRINGLKQFLPRELRERLLQLAAPPLKHTTGV